MKIKQYKPLFKEAFLKADMEKAINLVCKVLSKRLGDKIFVSKIPESFEKVGQGYFSGLHCTTTSGKQLRFNWKMSDTSGTIVSIDIWYNKDFDPDITIDLNGLNVVHIIDTIAEAILNKKPNEYMVLAEEVNPIGNKQVSKDIANAINQWLKDMDFNEQKLANSRMSYLHKDYEFWRTEVSTETFKSISLPTFTTYMLILFEKNGIKNVFVKKVTVKKAVHDGSNTDPEDQKNFNKALYAMNLQDTIDYVKASVRAVVRGYENAVVIAGTAGIGKTRLVDEVLKDDNVPHKKISGGIKNTAALFDLLKANNKPNFLIVFDDCDDIFSKNNSDIMKAALAPDKKRTIVWYDTKHQDAAVKEKNKPVIEDFKSRIIIITNKAKDKLPQAIISRTAPIEINVDIPDILDNLRINVETIMSNFSEVTNEIKLEVLDFIETTLKGVIKQIDYRLFERCVIYRMSGNPSWKKFCLPILT